MTGEDLAECMIYKKRSWKGVLPVTHLAHWASDKQVRLVQVQVEVEINDRLWSIEVRFGLNWSDFRLYSLL